MSKTKSNEPTTDDLSRVSQAMGQCKDFSEEQEKEFREVFRLFDKNGDNTISSRELVTVLRSLGQDPSTETAQGMLAAFDTDGSGTVEFSEFLALMKRLADEGDTEEDLIQIFRIIDQDGDGYISKADLREMVVSIGSKLTNLELEEMIDEADKDGDGLIDFEEFVKIIQTRC